MRYNLFRIVFRVFGWLSAAIVIFTLFIMSIAVWHGAAAYADIKQATASMKVLDIPRAGISLVSAREHLDTVHTILVLAEPFERLPVIGTQLLASRLTVEAGHDGFAAAELLLKPAETALAALRADVPEGESMIAAFRSLTPHAKRILLQTLSSASPQIRQVIVRLHGADQSLAQIPSNGVMSAIRDRVDPVRVALHSLVADLDAFAPLTSFLPEFLGANTEHTLLFVIQNSDELRPTGGFIGTYGIFHAKDGDFSLSDVRDVYTVDRPAAKFFHEIPPAPFVKYLASSGWFFRDANWSPSWPESAARLMDFYTREKGERASELDGVIAITPRVISRLAALVGCMTIQDVEFCPQNILERVQYEVEKGYDIEGVPEPQRKQIIIPLATEFLRRLYALPSDHLPAVFDIVRDSFVSKDVLVWSTDVALQSASEQVGISGRVGWTTPDGLMVVDANLGGMKTDPYVKRTIRYSVVPDGDSLIGMVSIDYRNTAPEENWKWTTYRDYVRLYVPQGSEWISTVGSLDNDRSKNPTLKEGKTVVTDELGLTSFGTFVAVGIGESRTLTFRFLLAPQVVSAIRRGQYSLTVVRQPGSPDPGLKLDIPFREPIVGAQPPEDLREFSDSRYRLSTDLSVDRVFMVRTH